MTDCRGKPYGAQSPAEPAGLGGTGPDGGKLPAQMVSRSAVWGGAVRVTCSAPQQKLRASPLTWVLWRATWTPPKEGAYRLIVRATDAAGALQDSHAAPSYPSGSSGYHTIQVNVSR